MAQTQSFDLHGLLQRVMLEAHAAWRYRWQALIVAWCVAIVGAILVFGLPSKYQAGAQVYADTDALTNPLLRGIAVQPDVDGRLDIITHTLLSRPNLEAVADKTGLALRATTPGDKDALLNRLGEGVKIKDAGAKNLYNLAYADTNPQMAQKVVQAFLQILMNDTLGANTASTESAQNFLQQQVDDYSKRLNAAEEKLADFEKANIAFIPNQSGADYFTRLQNAQASLASLEAQRGAVAHGRPVRHVAGAAVDPRVAALDKQIDAYQERLGTLLLSYTNEYPDVVSTRRAISQLEAQRAALASGRPAAGTPSSTVAAAEPADTRALDAQIAAQQQQVATLKQNLDKVASAQVTLQHLTRDYDATKRQYTELVTRLNTAQLSQDASQSGNNLKFRVINPPFVAPHPVSPRRGLLLLVVFVFAVGIGGAFAYFLHLIKPVFVSMQSLGEFSDYPVIGAVSMIVSPARRHRQRREATGFIAGVGAMALVMAVGLVFDGHIAHVVQHVFALGAL
ncbi:MAG TPA: XrtA system polysaccharide chain length determinant [Rhodanobacteraceae bacterium]|nr:XrtA system polysaccharide chain length determinant [Rhodanobacteraceae bacterium]